MKSCRLEALRIQLHGLHRCPWITLPPLAAKASTCLGSSAPINREVRERVLYTNAFYICDRLRIMATAVRSFAALARRFEMPKRSNCRLLLHTFILVKTSNESSLCLPLPLSTRRMVLTYVLTCLCMYASGRAAQISENRSGWSSLRTYCTAVPVLAHGTRTGRLKSHYLVFPWDVTWDNIRPMGCPMGFIFVSWGVPWAMGSYLSNGLSHGPHICPMGCPMGSYLTHGMSHEAIFVPWDVPRGYL